MPATCGCETDLLLNPRLWAEEGKVFYSFARHHSLWQIFTTPQVGYLTLFNGIVSALQAKVFPVEAAATVSTYAGLIVQLVPISIVLMTSHSFWNSPLKKLVCVLIIILVTPHELWINTTNSHFVFGLITFLILVIPAAQLSEWGKWLFRCLLVLGSLSGPASTLLTPIFLLKAYAERSREKNIQTVIQICCAVLQTAVTVHSILYNNQYHRLQQYDLSRTANNFVVDNFSMNLVAFGPTGSHAIGLLLTGYVVFLLIRHRKSSEHLVFLVSFVLVAVLSTIGSLRMAGSPRYGYVPTCILLLLIASEAFSFRPGQKPAHAFAAVLLVLSLTINAIYFKSRMAEIHAPVYPTWKDEVVKWRADPNYKPIIRPNDWYVEM